MAHPNPTSKTIVLLKAAMVGMALLLTMHSCPVANADSRRILDKPMMFGPQYPLLFLSTTFEPDTAFLLKSGEFFASASYSLLNSYVYSSNSAKAYDRNAPASEFESSGSRGYSVYMDGEMDHRSVKLSYGFSDAMELQFSYQDFRFSKGNMDEAIDNFHEVLNIGSQGRENTERNLLEIYIHDNETGENVFIVTQPSSGFIQQSMTVGLKIGIKETRSESISFSVSSNFGDYFIERELNEATSDADLPPHRDFNDYNATLRYSSSFDSWSFHAAYSVSFVENSLLKKSPDSINYFFLGANWHFAQNWSLIFQALDYSSPFPKDKSTIGEDIREVTAGLRWFFGKNSVFELGLIENQSQGPQNIDIVFFSNLMVYL